MCVLLSYASNGKSAGVEVITHLQCGAGQNQAIGIGLGAGARVQSNPAAAW